ncbi:MAG: DUF6527 family protein [Phycisphaera sp.]|nr:MAG: DUF6527 family protein [Phycisphaera sp.]
MSWFRRLWSWFKNLFVERPSTFETARVEEAPEILRPQTVYLIGEDGGIWSVAMRCPCGCGADIHLSTVGGRPRWSVRTEEDDTVTLSPSVWRKAGCKSHFFLRRGMIQWCAESP